MKNMVTGFFSFMAKEKVSLLEKELAERKQKIRELREYLRKLKKERRIDKSKMEVKMSQLRIQEYRLVMKESKLNEMILLKEEQIKKAWNAENDFDNALRDINILLKTKTMTAHNSIKELKHG
jgi:predicted RNase H-like nuclease (RuvC/YqgF family)